MASYENLTSVEPWSVYRSLLSDSYFGSPWMVSSSDPLYLESETMTKALSASMSPTTTTTVAAVTPAIDVTLTELLNNVQLPAADTPPQGQSSLSAGSAGSGSASASDPETVPKRVSRNNIPVAPSSGKGTKRKSRASKKSPTTFITADPANFRQMVQQVTGVKFAAGGGPVPVTQILKPEAKRVGIIGSTGSNSGFGRLQGCLPTLDTSAFFLDHHHHQVSAAGGGGGGASAATASGVRSGSGLGFIAQSVVTANGGGGAAGVDFDGYPSFPTLESCRF